MKKILFICLGNICRSPMAEYVMRQVAKEQHVDHLLQIDSAGTSGWHDGEDMHHGTKQMLASKGIDNTGFTSSKIKPTDFDYYDYLIVMDDSNLENVEKLFGKHPEKLFKLTDLIPETGYSEVPDPWFTKNFDETYDLIRPACEKLLAKLNLS